MNGAETLLSPGQCVMLFVDFQAGLALGVESTARQTLLDNAIALARTSQGLRCTRYRLDFGIAGIQRTSVSRLTDSAARCRANRTAKYECMSNA